MIEHISCAIIAMTSIGFLVPLIPFKNKNQNDDFNETIIALIKREFDRIDVDGNGHITKEEMKEAIMNLHPTLSSEEYEKTFQYSFDEMDIDKSGTIEFDEFAQLMVPNMKYIAKQFYQQFQSIDTNRDGFIDKNDLSQSITKSYETNGVQYSLEDVEKSVNATFEKYDEDRDGLLNFTQFTLSEMSQLEDL
jgi:Ca2+-binding EF-hand superfamily protein